MIGKEMLERRWQLIGGLILGLVMVSGGLVSRLFIGDAMSPSNMGQVPEFMRGQLELVSGSWNAYAWYQAFAPNQATGLIVLVLAVLIGAGTIAGEVGRGTIFTLLSRPLSRTRVLLTKYAVGAGILLAVEVFGIAVMMVVSSILGHPQPLAGAAVSLLNFWLGSLFVLGLATVFSTISNDVLRPIAYTAVAILALTVPAFFQGGSDWVLFGYWSSLPAYQGEIFPWKNLLVTLVAAIVPLAVAVPLFRRQQY